MFRRSFVALSRLPVIPSLIGIGEYWVGGRKVGDSPIEDYKDIKNIMTSWGLENHIKVPTSKVVVSVHGGISSGKSSFINDLMGLSVQRTFKDEEDTCVTLILTVDEYKFEALRSQLVVKYDERVAKTLTFDDLKSKIHRDVYPDVKSSKFAVLLLEGESALREAQRLGFGELTKITDHKVRLMMINEKIYNLPGVTGRLFETHARVNGGQKWLTTEERIELAKTLVVVDTPGLCADDSTEAGEIDAILRNVSHSFFITSGIANVDVEAIKNFANALHRVHSPNSKKNTAVWNKITILVSKLDENPAGLIAANKKFSVALQDIGRKPVDGMFRNIGLPSIQRAKGVPEEKRHAGDLPSVHKALLGRRHHAKTNDGLIGDSITYMSKILINHIDSRTFSKMYDSLWIWYDPFSGVRVSDRPIAAACLSHYNAKAQVVDTLEVPAAAASQAPRSAVKT